MSTYSMTSDDLIRAIKLQGFIPVHQSTFTNEDILVLADKEIALGMVPTVLRMHESYFQYTEKVDLQTNVTRYAIPYRAIGNKLCELAYEDNSGNIFEMTRITVDDLPWYNQSSYNQPYAFYIENNEICLTPGNASFGSGTKLRVTYYMRPNRLVELNKVGVISSIDRMTGVIQLESLPELFKITSKLDLISILSPNKTLDYDITPTAINSTSKTVTLNIDDIPTSLSVGDHVSLATQAAVPQIPSDLQFLLEQRVVSRCLEALGDMEGLASSNQKIVEMSQQAEALIDNRVEGAPMKISNRHSSLRGSILNRRNRFRGF